jgi:hypothetical protein
MTIKTLSPKNQFSRTGGFGCIMIPHLAEILQVSKYPQNVLYKHGPPYMFENREYQKAHHRTIKSLNPKDQVSSTDGFGCSRRITRRRTTTRRLEIVKS